MKTLAILTSALSAVLRIGCDTISGSSRTVTVSRLPPSSTVISALNSVPGVQRITQREVPPQTSWGLYHGVIHDPAYNQFYFATAKAAGTVETKLDPNGIKTLHIYCLWINYTPPKPKFDAAR